MFISVFGKKKKEETKTHTMCVSSDKKKNVITTIALISYNEIWNEKVKW